MLRVVHKSRIAAVARAAEGTAAAEQIVGETSQLERCAGKCRAALDPDATSITIFEIGRDLRFHASALA